MKKAIRQNRFENIMIVISVFIFFIFAPVLLFYALGYRYDTENRQLIKTGGIFLSFWPDSANVYIDGVLQQKRYRIDPAEGFRQIVQGENLVPGNHQVQISVFGYHNWEKTVRIDESKVTVIENILLLPENPVQMKLTEFKNNEIKNLTISPREDKIAFLVYPESIVPGIVETSTSSQRTSQPELWQIDLNNNKTKIIAEADIIKHLLDFSTIPIENYSIDDLIWSPDETKILYNIRYSDKEIWGIVDTFTAETQPLHNSSINYAPAKIYSPVWTSDSQKIIFWENGDLYMKNLNSSNTPKHLLSNISGFSLKDNMVYFVTAGLLYKSSLSDLVNDYNNREQISDNSLPPNALADKPAQIMILKNGQIFIWFPQYNLYYLNKNKTFGPINSAVAEVKPSPNENILAYINGGEVWVYYLEDDIYLNKKANSQELITRYSRGVSSLWWLEDSFHLLFDIKGEIKITEIDNRDYRQISNPLPALEINELVYRPDHHAIYYIDASLTDKNIFEIKLK